MESWGLRKSEEYAPDKTKAEHLTLVPMPTVLTDPKEISRAKDALFIIEVRLSKGTSSPEEQRKLEQEKAHLRDILPV